MSMTNEPTLPAVPTRAEVKTFLDFDWSGLMRRRDEDIIPALERMVADHPTIEDGDERTAGIFAENKKMAETLIRSAKSMHDDAKKPYLDVGREIDEWTKNFTALIEAALAPVYRIALAYAKRKDQIERDRRAEAARKAQEEADAKALAARKALERDAASPRATVALDQAAKAAEEAERASAAASAPVAETSRTRGMYGSTMGIRTTWGWEGDMRKLIAAAAAAIAQGNDPPWLRVLTIDSGALRELMQDRDAETRRPLAVIPGITWVEQQSVGKARETA